MFILHAKMNIEDTKGVYIYSKELLVNHYISVSHAYTQTIMCVHAHTYVHTLMHTHAQTHMHAHTYTHTHMGRNSISFWLFK